jgi:hypothetical protein
MQREHRYRVSFETGVSVWFDRLQDAEECYRTTFPSDKSEMSIERGDGASKRCPSHEFDIGGFE